MRQVLILLIVALMMGCSKHAGNPLCERGIVVNTIYYEECWNSAGYQKTIVLMNNGERVSIRCDLFQTGDSVTVTNNGYGYTLR